MPKRDRENGPASGDCLPVGSVSGDVRILGDDEDSVPCGPLPGPVSGADIVTGSDDTLTQAGDPDATLPVQARLPRTDRNLLIISAVAVVALALFAVFSRAAAEVVSLWSISPLAGGGFLAALMIVVAAISVLAGRSWGRYRRLRDVTRIRQMIIRYESTGTDVPGTDARIRNELEHYLSDLERRGALVPRKAIREVRTKFRDYTGDGARDVGELEECLLRSLDKQADSIIERRAVQVAVGTALASRSFDGLIVLWQSAVLIDQVSQLYAGRPGLWGTLRLLRRGMAMVVFAEIADLAAQALAGAVTQKPLAVLGGRAAEGTANGLMMLRLGEAIKEQCRPVPCRGRPANPVRRLIVAFANQGLGN